MFNLNLVIHLLVIYIIIPCIDARMCQWPDDVCIPIHNCVNLNNQLYQNDLKEETIHFLREKQCGYTNGTVYVCCKSALPDPAICGPFVPGSRIVHGQVTGINQFPWTALLVNRLGNDKEFLLQFNCGGTLINNRYVLTSAHCVTKNRSNVKPIMVKKLFEVRLGEWNKTNEEPDQLKFGIFENETITADPVLKLGVEKYIIHENYRPEDRKNDIALLKLSEEVKFSPYIKPICLPKELELSVPEKQNSLTIMGWGQTEYRNYSDVKLFAHITYVPKSKCEHLYREHVGYQFRGKIYDEQFCAGGRSDSCVGDSGGPVVSFDDTKLSYYIVGIVTYGVSPCGANLIPGIYTKISDYVDWIIQNMEHDL